MMHCTNYTSDMALAMCLYDLSPLHRSQSAEVLIKRGSRLSWEALSLALQAPFHPEDEAVQIALLKLIQESPDLPKISAQVVCFFAYIQRSGSLAVKDALRLLQADLGSKVMVQILTGYDDQ